MLRDEGGRKATANEVWHQELAREIEASCNPWISPMMIEAHELLEGRTYQERISRRVDRNCIANRDEMV
jgi:hypothetical protein